MSIARSARKSKPIDVDDENASPQDERHDPYSHVNAQDYDAVQDPAHRRNLRGLYRLLKAKKDRNADEAVRPQSETLKHLTQLSDYHYRYVHGPVEAALDADVQHDLATLGLEKSTNLGLGLRKYEAKEFVARLIHYAGAGRATNWLALGRDVRYYYRRSFGLSTMYGPITIEEKERKVRQRLAREAVVKAIAPDVIVNTETEAGQNETCRRVESVYKVLRRVERRRQKEGRDIEFYEFVVNPHSFTQTVENIFHVSFLVRQSHAKLTKAPDGRLLVASAKPANGAEAGVTNQAVFIMSMALWRRIVAKLGLTEPLIETRPNVDTRDYLPNSLAQAADDDDDPIAKSRQTKKRRAASKRHDDDADESVEELAKTQHASDDEAARQKRSRGSRRATDDNDDE